MRQRICRNNKVRKGQIQDNRGITLIALVITIIILLILAGITINLTFGENGLLNRSESVKQKHEEEAAREKLEIALAEIYSHKHTNKDYNENEFIDNKLNSQGMPVIPETNIVIVDNWLFEIDRSVPKIVNSFGKGNENKNIQIVAKSVMSSDYVTATIQAQITFDGELSLILLKGNKIDIPVAENGVYNIEEVVRENGTYTLMVKDKEGNYKVETIKITELTEDMDIWNKQDMESFRDKVNSGRTFEGKTVRVMDNIDLEGTETNKWIPIADYASNNKLFFKGTFDGQNHNINNIYINSTKNYQGLFGINYGIIKNVKINGRIQSTGMSIGSITGHNRRMILNCHNSAYIQGTQLFGGIVGVDDSTNGLIEKCSNSGEICSNVDKSVGNIGGIVGQVNSTTVIKECYNTGYIHALGLSVGGICGYRTTSSIYNCYNTGKIEAKRGRCRRNKWLCWKTKSRNCLYI